MQLRPSPPFPLRRPSIPMKTHATIPSTLDTTRIDDLRIGAVRPLITPALLQ